ESDLLLQRAADALDHASFNLVPNRTGIDHETTVVADDHALHLHHAGLAVDRDFEYARNTRFGVSTHHGDTASKGDVVRCWLRMRGPSLPLRSFRGGFKNSHSAIEREVFQTEFYCIHAGSRSQFIHETFGDENIIRRPHAAHGSHTNSQRPLTVRCRAEVRKHHAPVG